MPDKKYPDDVIIRSVCKIGQGPMCCRYLTMGSSGWSCEKLTINKSYFDGRVASGSFTAKGDNCEGMDSR